ncbi:hypothetical protein HID58_083246, partial [Brassica napus]
SSIIRDSERAFVEDRNCLRLETCLSNWFPFVEDLSQRLSILGRSESSTIFSLAISYAFHVVVDFSKVNPYRDVVKKEGVVVKEEDQLDVDVKGSFLLLDVLRDQGNPFKLCLHVFLFYFLLTQFPVWSELFMLSLQGRNLVIEHSWGAPKVKNVVASLVKVAGDDTYTALLFP